MGVIIFLIVLMFGLLFAIRFAQNMANEDSHRAACEVYKSEYTTWRQRYDAMRTLPTVSCGGMVLARGEVCYAAIQNVSLYETRAVRVTDHMFASQSLGRGFRIGGGQAVSRSHQEWTPISSGELYITNRQICFHGDMQSRTIPFSKLTAALWDDDLIEVSSSSRQKTMVFRGLNGHMILDVLNFAMSGRHPSLPPPQPKPEPEKPRELTLEEKFALLDKKTADGRFVID